MKLTIQIESNYRGRVRAMCPSLPGCVGSGSSAPEALDRFLEAARGYLAAVGNFVPARLTALLVPGDRAEERESTQLCLPGV